MTRSKLSDAVRDIWDLPNCTSDDLRNSTAFERLFQVCSLEFGLNEGMNDRFALNQAVETLGPPCLKGRRHSFDETDIEDAALKLSRTLQTDTENLIHLLPLDLADELPKIQFGPAAIRRFSAKELADVLNLPGLANRWPGHRIDIDRLCRFQWLMVCETRDATYPIGKRSLPILYAGLWEDHGAVRPHDTELPVIVQRALYVLFLAPWEMLVEDAGYDWRGLTVPFLHTVSDDLIARPGHPPDADQMTWRPRFDEDVLGHLHESEEPEVTRLKSDAEDQLRTFLHDNWPLAEAAFASPLLETPVVHFLLKGHQETGIDSFIAHLTMIEAALGSQTDFNRSQRTTHKNCSATQRLKRRVAALLDDTNAAAEFKALYDLRSAFLHGRAMQTAIPTASKNLARSLARRVATALLSEESPKARELFLEKLLARSDQLLAVQDSSNQSN